MTCELLPFIICDLLVAWRTEEGASKRLDVNEDALGLRIWGRRSCFCTCGQCAGKAVAALSSLCPRRWAHRLMCLWIHMGMGMPSPTAHSAPRWLCVLKCCLSPWQLASGHGGRAVVFWTSGAVLLALPGQLCKKSPKKNLGKVWLWRNAWPFSSPPSNFLLPGVQAHPGQPGGKPQSKNWRINRFSALCQSLKCWETRPCAPC